MTVIHHRLPGSPVVAVDVWVKAGAIAEPDPWFGMAHFLEHMIFKGTDQLPPGCFDQVIENRGGVTNAATSHDYAHYYITTTTDHLNETLPYLAELLVNAAIPDDEFDRERDVVLEEIRQSQDDPDWVAFQALMESTYQRHPYGRPVLGTEDQLLERSPDEMRLFHRAHYQPRNMTVVVVGDADQALTLDLVNKAFSQFSPPPPCPLADFHPELPVDTIRRQELFLPRIEQARLLMAWVGPGIDQLRTAYGLDLLSIVLAGGRSSQLVRELREERQLVQGIGSNFSLQRDSSLLTISAWLDPQHVAQVETIICDRLAQLAATPLTSAELNRCQRLLCNDYAFSTETSSQLAGLYGYYNTIAQAEMSVRYPEQIRSFRAHELQQLAHQFLSPERYVATVLNPF
ncbi:MAG: M16 family metallopeptidase [Elainellaceae cyanobacterium]